MNDSLDFFSKASLRKLIDIKSCVRVIVLHFLLVGYSSTRRVPDTTGLIAFNYQVACRNHCARWHKRLTFN